MLMERYNHETERLHAQIKVDLEGDYVDTKYLSIIGQGTFDKTRLKNIGNFIGAPHKNSDRTIYTLDEVATAFISKGESKVRNHGGSHNDT